MKYSIGKVSCSAESCSVAVTAVNGPRGRHYLLRKLSSTLSSCYTLMTCRAAPSTALYEHNRLKSTECPSPFSYYQVELEDFDKVFIRALRTYIPQKHGETERTLTPSWDNTRYFSEMPAASLD